MIARRDFVKACVAGAILRGPHAAAAPRPGQARFHFPMNDGWVFSGPDAGNPARVTLPHCVGRLSWQDWDPAIWEKPWLYRRHFQLPDAARGRRVFLQFDGVMVGATPTVNGHALPEHLGGYLPFRYEITDWIKPGDNLLSVVVDSRWRNVPPEGSPKGPASIDYLEPGGIVRGAGLDVLPPAYISDVFAKPVHVIDSGRRVEVLCTVDAARPGGRVQVETALLDGERVLTQARQELAIEKAGETSVALTLADPGNVALWEVENPRLYDVVTTLSVAGRPVHEHRARIGFREAVFDTGGFRLNGRRVQLFGLNRHELFPYVGAAMPARAMRRDAEILKREFHCNAVRCSHYPQSEAFLDACDDLGLMVWEEVPGWQYLGDDAWRELLLRDVGDMVRRDRNHPAIVIWGVRINESRNDLELYRRTREIARRLDDSRPTSGSMTTTRNWETEWHQDVFALDDYHADPDGSVGIHPPLSGVPYMLAETVGQYNYATAKGFGAQYRRTADTAMQQAQALRHAQAHDRAAAFPRCAGVIAWCAFDYGSLMNSYRAVKYPGIADVFRIPKLGAAFYRSQVSPDIRPVIVPAFYWDFGPQSPGGPGKRAAIFSNCERLRLFVDGNLLAGLEPDREGFPHLRYPPFLCDLAFDGHGAPELRIEGYVGNRLALSQSFSSDHARDQFVMEADDAELSGDGSDATRLVFRVADRFGQPRPFAGGEVRFEIAGPGEIVGDSPFALADAGGAGAVWVRTRPGGSGRITVTATHSALGRRTVEISVRRA